MQARGKFHSHSPHYSRYPVIVLSLKRPDLLQLSFRLMPYFINVPNPRYFIFRALQLLGAAEARRAHNPEYVLPISDNPIRIHH
jgi:hypothetical protein